MSAEKQQFLRFCLAICLQPVEIDAFGESITGGVPPIPPQLVRSRRAKPFEELGNLSTLNIVDGQLDRTVAWQSKNDVRPSTNRVRPVLVQTDACIKPIGFASNTRWHSQQRERHRSQRGWSDQLAGLLGDQTDGFWGIVEGPAQIPAVCTTRTAIVREQVDNQAR